MKITLFIRKKGYPIFTFIVIVLCIIEGCVHLFNPFHANFPKLLPILPMYILTLGWFYITGMVNLIKSVSLFKEKKIGFGIGLLVIGLLFFVFSRYAVNYLFMFLYGNV